jgi:tight adherence protein B
MVAALFVFLLVTGSVLGGYFAWGRLAAAIARRQMEERLRDVGPSGPVESTIVKQREDETLPALQRLLAKTSAGPRLTRVIDQSGTGTNPGTIIAASLCCAAATAVLASVSVRLPFVAPMAGLIGLSLPVLWLMRRRTARVRRFEEQFPDALDLLSRAIRAGHAFQTALGMGADELPPPVGIEFKKVFEQQNFGLPLREALAELAERVPLLDVKFFVTAIAIQRESGGNLAEILDNLAHVVRERFKILRQVRTHTAHGRFTGFVLLALPAALAIALSFISPGHMELLFSEPMGRMMIAGAIVMQTVGFVWIRQVIKIEV